MGSTVLGFGNLGFQCLACKVPLRVEVRKCGSWHFHTSSLRSPGLRFRVNPEP